MFRCPLSFAFSAIFSLQSMNLCRRIREMFLIDLSSRLIFLNSLQTTIISDVNLLIVTLHLQCSHMQRPFIERRSLYNCKSNNLLTDWLTLLPLLWRSKTRRSSKSRIYFRIWSYSVLDFPLQWFLTDDCSNNSIGLWLIFAIVNCTVFYSDFFEYQIRIDRWNWRSEEEIDFLSIVGFFGLRSTSGEIQRKTSFDWRNWLRCFSYSEVDNY